jgi:3-phenylpropionate/trans-cinnamate dioxygenase ferredoxin reductase component
MNEPVIVVGAGQAAAQLATSLRQGGFRGGIRVIGDEPYLPYQRPPLSKKFLAEPARPDSLLLRPESFWRDQDVAIELGTPVAALDRQQNRVVLGDGRAIDYGTLVLATGTRARTLALPGVDLPGVFSVRRIEDVRLLRPALDAASRSVIIGGGYIGLEVAAVMRAEGRDVTVIEAEDRVMKRVTGEMMSSYFERVHRERGVDLRLRARLAGIEGEQRATGVRLADGTTLPADLVLVATGARANDDLAVSAGLAADDGILVDEFTCTGTANVLAIGDCARFPSRRFGRRLRLECVQNAIEQAKAAAATILGQPAAYDPVPWFWSDQYDIKFQMAGLMDGHDDAVPVGDTASGRFSVDYRCAGRLIAVDAVNDGRAHMLGRRRIAKETAAAPVG